MKAFRIDQLENTDTLLVLFYTYVTVVLRLFKVSYFKERLGVHTDNDFKLSSVLRTWLYTLQWHCCVAINTRVAAGRPFIFLSVELKKYTSAFLSSVNANATFCVFYNLLIFGFLILSWDLYCCKDKISIYSALYELVLLTLLELYKG